MTDYGMISTPIALRVEAERKAKRRDYYLAAKARKAASRARKTPEHCERMEALMQQLLSEPAQ